MEDKKVKKSKTLKARTGRFSTVFNLAKIEVEKSCSIYRVKFLKEYTECKENNFSENNTIFCIIFLQIYFENFFHQKLRKLIELEFKNSDPKIYKKWNDKEKENVRVKLDNFIYLLNQSGDNDIIKLKNKINKNFKYITDKRNLLVHGHKIAEGSNFSGEKYKTEAKKILTEPLLNSCIEKVNKGGYDWNNLLEKLSPSFNSFNVQTINDFKFKEIKIT